MQQYLYIVHFSKHAVPLPIDIMYTIEAHLHGWQQIYNNATWFLFSNKEPNLVNQILQHDFQQFKLAADCYQIIRYHLPACGVRPIIMHGQINGTTAASC